MNNFNRFFEYNKKPSINCTQLNYIDIITLSTEIERIEEIINQHSLSSSLSSKDNESKNSEVILEVSSSHKNSLTTLEIKTPKTSVSAKNSIDFLLRSLPYGKTIAQFISMTNDEIKKVFISYTNVEKDLYHRINSQILFKKQYKEFNILQITTRLKELHSLLTDIKMLCDYTQLNFLGLKVIFEQFNHLSAITGISNIGVKAFRSIFESPNSDINYVLQFKIIDEGNTICEYLFNKLRKRYNKLNIEKNLKKSMEQVKNESNIVSTDDTSKSSSFLSSISREDITLLTSFEELISKDKAGEKIASRSIKSLNNGFIHKIKNLLLEIDNDNKYRAKFVNLCIFFRYGFKSRLSHKHNSGINLEDESASIQINTLMDEELIIKKFFSNKAIKEYYKLCFDKLTPENKSNISIVLLHYGIFFFFYFFTSLYETELSVQGMMILSLYVGRLFSKIIFGFLLYNNKTFKLSLLLSFILYSIGFLLTYFHNENSQLEESIIKRNALLIISRFIIGMANANTINSKYIITYLPRALLKLHILKYNYYRYIFTSIGLLMYVLFKFLKPNNYIIKNYSNDQIKDLLCVIISLVIFTCFFLKFKDPQNKYFSMFSSDGISSSISGLEQISVGKRKKISGRETKMIEEANNQLLKENTNSSFNDINYIQMLMCKLIKKEKRNICGYLSSCFYAIMFSLITSFFSNIFLFVLLSLFAPTDYSFLSFALGYLSIIIVIFLSHQQYSICNWKRQIEISLMILLLIEIVLFGGLLILIYLDIKNYLIILPIISILVYGNVMIELQANKVLSKLFPQNWVNFGINCSLFIELTECIVKGTFCGFIFLFDEMINYKMSISLFYLLTGGILFIAFNIAMFLIFGRSIEIKALARSMKKTYYI